MSISDQLAAVGGEFKALAKTGRTGGKQDVELAVRAFRLLDDALRNTEAEIRRLEPLPGRDAAVARAFSTDTAALLRR